MLVEYLHDGTGDQRLSPFFVPKFFRKIFQGTHRHVAAGLPTITQSNIRGEGCLILIIEVGVIPNRDLWSSVRNLRFSHRLRFFLLTVVRMTSFCNFFPAAKKLPRKVARSLSGTPAFRFARRRGLRNSLRSNSPRPISVFFLAPGSPIKAGIFPLRHYRPLRVRTVTLLSFRIETYGRV